MPAPDRLAELRRQRALLQEHATWLDREIAEEERRRDGSPDKGPIKSPGVSPSAAPLADVVRSTPNALSDAPTTEPTEIVDGEAEQILDEYRVEPSDVHRDVRKGCLMYFAASLIALALVVTALYLALRH